VGSGQEVVLKVVFPDPDLDRADGVKEKAPSQSQLDSFRREIDILSVIDEPRTFQRCSASRKIFACWCCKKPS